MKTLTQTIAVSLISLLTLTGAASAHEPHSAMDSEWIEVQDADVEQEVSEQHLAGEAKFRPNFYVNGMVFGASLSEDGDNRLTSRGGKDLEGSGLILRTGGVIKDQHLLGVLFQGYWRGTDSVLDSAGGDDKLGMVHAYHIGPEYRYQTSFGLYFGGSLGLGMNFADNDMSDDGGDEPGCNSASCFEDYLDRNNDHLAVGVGLVGVIGYEFRPTKYFALNAEAFVTHISAMDENERSMDTTIAGFAIGIGI
jgi:hypothetical protein